MFSSKINLKKLTIKEKDLTKDGVWGWATQDESFIEIEKNQPSKEYLNTLIHEMLHCIFPDMSEKMVTKIANIMSDTIWKKNYRRIKK